MGEQDIQNYDLPEVVDVDSMDAMREWLLEAVEIGNIRIEGAAVSRVVTNGLLMLLSARQNAQKNQFTFSIVNPSSALIEAIERLGMENFFAQIIEGN